MDVPVGRSINELRVVVARCCRVLHQLGLVDLLGHVSGRAPGTHYLVIPPRYGPGVPTNNVIGAEDLLVVDLEGRVVEGRGEPVSEVWMHTEIYKRRPDVNGIVHTHQKTSTAFGVTGREIKPFLNQGAEITIQPIPVYASPGLINTRGHGQALAAVLGDASVCHLQGHGVVVVANSVEHTTICAHWLEGLAKMNVLAMSLGEGTPITREEVERHLRDRRAGAHVFHYYEAIDPGPRPLPASPPFEDDLQRVRYLTALSCRILYHYGLVGSLEHVSIRIPGTDRFTFSPALNMGRIQAEDIAVIDLQGNHLDGPYRPPPYIWAFIEIYKARPDVQAIVHTHQPYGRAFALTGRAILPVQRDGAYLFTREVPIHQSPDLIYDSERGLAFARTLGQGHIVHARGHGTEYVAQTIEMATNWAVLLERQAEINHLALLLGRPKVLPTELAAGTAEEDPSPGVWWQYYRTLVA